MLSTYRAFLISALLLCSPVTAQDFQIDEAVKSDRDAVRSLQSQLNDLGFDTGRPDGAFGRKTQAGIEGFATRFPTDGAEGLSQAMLDRIAVVHAGRFVSSFEEGLLVKPFDNAVNTRLLGVTDMREVPGCEACNATTFTLGAADMDGDGAVELLLHQHAQDSRFDVIDKATPMTIFSGRPGHGIARRDVDFVPKTMPSRVHAREAVFGDFNGDGLADVFVASHGLDASPFPGEQNVLLLTSPSGIIDVSETHLPMQNDMAHGADAGDIDGDGDLDIFVITNQGSTQVLPYLLRNDGTGRFTMEPASAILDPELIDFNRGGRRFEAEYSTVRLSDMNGDGAPDILLLARGEEPSRTGRGASVKSSVLLYNDGTGQFPLDTLVVLPTDRWGDQTFTNDADAVDLDGDGATDLVLTLSTRPRGGLWRGHYIQVLMQQDGAFVDRTAERIWPQRYDAPLERLNFADKTRLADFDGDGDLDIVTHTLSPAFRDQVGDQAITIGLNDGTGVFAPVDPDWISEGPGFDRGFRGRAQATGDFDGNGVADIVSYQLNGQYGDGPDRTFGVTVYVHRPVTK